MSVYAGDPTSFPADGTLPDDGVAIDAADTNPPTEVVFDRTAFIAKRVLPSGITTFNPPATAIPTDLSLLTGVNAPSDLDTRVLPGYGMYIYRSAFTSATHPSDGLLVVDGPGGVGKWLKIDYALGTMRLVQKAFTRFSGAALQFNITAYTANDPAARNPGNTQAIKVLELSPQFELHPGDVLEIGYALPYHLKSTTSSPITGDPVVGVGYRVPAGAAFSFFDETIAREAQTTGSDSNGIAMTQDGVSVASRRYDFARSVTHTVTLADIIANPQDAIFGLVAGCDAAQAGAILQGAMLSVAQWRGVL